jgi:hypothetical protein
MFAKKLKAIVVVHNDSVHWVTRGRSDHGPGTARLALDALLEDPEAAGRIPSAAKGNHQSLWIVPDHWFGMESYPFQSDKSSLIVPFLERKLGAAHPECKAIRQFFNYRRVPAAGGGHELLAYFPQDEKAYRLYDALDQAHLAPRYITTPAFLWVDRLSRLMPDFGQEGTLLVHMGAGECQLYFYFKGNYLFSRNVILSDGPDRMEALTFEINQSLYMFSQKTKSELSRVYLMAATADGPEVFNQALGREIVDLAPLLAGQATIELDEVPLLKGLLPEADAFTRPPFFSVTQRQAQRELAWEPVQYAGIAVGAALLLPLIGLNLLLGHMLRGDGEDHDNLRRQALSRAISLTEYQSAMAQVLQARQRPAYAETVRRVLASLPPGMRVEELGLTLEESPAVTLKATLPAQDAERLKATLMQLVSELKSRFELPADFSLGNIEIGMAPQEDRETAPQYRIALRLELT